MLSLRCHQTWVLLLLLTSASCSDTSIIVEVVPDTDSPFVDDGEALDTLQLFVGIADNPGDFTGERFLDTADQNGDEIDVGGRDLTAAPYRFRIDRAGQVDAPLFVIALGLADGEIRAVGSLPEPIEFRDGQIAKYRIELNPARGERIAVTTTHCVVRETSDGIVMIAPASDKDCDGDSVASDCDDTNPDIGSNQSEVCDNGIDDNCNGEIDEVIDQDQDSVSNCLDCDDRNADRYPGADEVCDGLDNDCNEVCDDGEADADEDGFTTCGSKILPSGACSNSSALLVDCNDDVDTVFPGAEELCDGMDNNCDTICDEGWDPDDDGFTQCGSSGSFCDGVTDDHQDCEVNNGDIHPGVIEACNGIDDNCDGVRYPSVVPCYVDTGSACLTGERACTDSSPNDGWNDLCVQDGGSIEVDEDFCDAYETCDAAGEPDPFVCANMMTSSFIVDCQLRYTDDGSIEACQPALAALPVPSGEPTCIWHLDSAMADAPVIGGLVKESDDPLPVTPGPLSDCEGLFKLAVDLDLDPTSERLYYRLLLYTNGNSLPADDYLLRVQPVKVDECPEGASPGLQCDFP